MVTSYVPVLVPSLVGQPPSMDRMTDQRVVVLGCISVDRAIWQEPPPWTAEPLKVMLMDSPAVAVLEIPEVE